MGQATLDLPDPTQLSGVNAGPLSPEALASADDLLSQLAGDDIDRLLAEADSERPPVIAPQTVVTAPPQVPVAEVLPAAPVVADSAAVTAAALDAILAPAIESTLQAVEAQVAAPEPTVAPAPAVVIAPAIVSEDPSSAALDEKLLDEAAAHVASIMDVPVAPAETAENGAERQALSEPLMIPANAGKPSAGISLLVKMLELINSPMLLVSDQVRDAMGKVALVTTFNAAAVLVYVMVFRRPHH